MSWVVTALTGGTLLWGLAGGGCAHVQGGLGASGVNAGVRMVPGEHESYWQEGGNVFCFSRGRQQETSWMAGGQYGWIVWDAIGLSRGLNALQRKEQKKAIWISEEPSDEGWC